MPSHLRCWVDSSASVPGVQEIAASIPQRTVVGGGETYGFQLAYFGEQAVLVQKKP
jgi:hypothetical protein